MVEMRRENCRAGELQVTGRDMIRAENSEESSVSPFRETSIERRKMVERAFTSAKELMRSSYCCWRIHYFPLSTLINIIYSLLRTCFLITRVIFTINLSASSTSHSHFSISSFKGRPSGASPASSCPSSQATPLPPSPSHLPRPSSPPPPCHSPFTPDIPPPPASEYYQEKYPTAVSPSMTGSPLPRIENC